MDERGIEKLQMNICTNVIGCIVGNRIERKTEAMKLVCIAQLTNRNGQIFVHEDIAWLQVSMRGQQGTRAGVHFPEHPRAGVHFPEHPRAGVHFPEHPRAGVHFPEHPYVHSILGTWVPTGATYQLQCMCTLITHTHTHTHAHTHTHTHTHTHAHTHTHTRTHTRTHTHVHTHTNTHIHKHARTHIHMAQCEVTHGHCTQPLNQTDPFRSEQYGST